MPLNVKTLILRIGNTNIMASTKQFKSFWEFYPYYLTEHSDRTCRALHFVGTTLVLLFFMAFLITFNWRYFAAIPLAGYGFAWVGHFAFEKNKPATFQYPFYSLGSDFVMYWHIVTGQLPAKMAEAKKIFG